MTQHGGARSAVESSDDAEVTPLDPGETTDGRSLRRRRNREAVIATLIGLINEGELNPTIDKIADRAGVSARSIFRYFTDLSDLARTAIETETRVALPLAVIPNVGEGDFDDRVERMVESRMRICNYAWQLGRVARSKAAEIPEIDRGLGLIVEMVRDQFLRHFATEFDQMDPATAQHIAITLASTTHFDAYDTQRRLLLRSDDEIADSWRVVIRRLLGSPDTTIG